MRSRPDPRPRLAPLRRPPATGGAAPAADPRVDEMAPAEPELGGWVPVVRRAPTDDDLLSEWAPRSGRGRGRHRTVQPEPPDGWGRPPEPGAGCPSGAPALRLVPADPGGWPEPAYHIEPDAEPDVEPDPEPDAEPDVEPDPEPDAEPDIEPDPEPDDGAGDAGGEPTEEAGVQEAGSRVHAHRINGRWGRFAELWVPESMREARVDPGRRGMIVLVLIAAVAAVVAAVGVWRDRPEPRPIETAVVAAASGAQTGAQTGGVLAAAASPAAAVGPTDASAAAPGPGSAASPGQSAVTEILVSVTGLVAGPGVVRLPPDARVADAIAAAGGTRPGADLTGMNLAAKLADGDSVVVTEAGAIGTGPGAPGSSGGSTQPAGGLVNLNTADGAALDTLPGVGPVMAQNILAWRETNGTFASVEQLQEISGIGPSRYAQLAPLVTVG